MNTLSDNIQLHDLEFEPYLTHTDVLERIKELAIEINQDYEDKDPVFVAVLNGSFMFASDLMKMVDLKSELTFIKVNSYEGLNTTNDIKQVIGINQDLTNRHVVIIEDIVDTGMTIDYILDEINKLNPSSVNVITLFHKPSMYKFNHYLKYVGFEIPNKFIVGYGLDYNGLGRNYQDVYQLAK